MQLMENNYEDALLLKLPPNARDVAEHLFTFRPLHELLILWLDNEPDFELLTERHVASQHWEAILNATLLAKMTYICDNPKFNQEEVLFLLKIACASAGLPLKAYTLAEVVELSKEDLPIFHDWLKRFAHRLKTTHQKNASLRISPP